MAQFLLSPCKTEELKLLWETVFGDPRSVTDSFFENAFFADGCFYECADGKTVSALYLLPVTFGDKKGFYLYAAATLPAYRGRGMMGALLKEALQYAKSVADFVYLCPAEKSLYDYYRRYGFSQTLCACFADNATCTRLTTAQEFYDLTVSMPNAPLFTRGVYRYAEDIGCELYKEGAARFDGQYVFAANKTDAHARPYGMLVPFGNQEFSEDFFAFLTMN